MTLNDVIALILHYFTNSFGGRLRHVVKDRPTCIMSAEYRLHFWIKLTHPAARSLCDSWATCN